MTRVPASEGHVEQIRADRSSRAIHAPALMLEDVACQRGGRLLFEGIDLTLRAGEALRLLGPNGSGKTSLLRLIAGLLRPAGGRVTCLQNGMSVPPLQAAHLLSHLDAVKPGLSVGAALRFWQDYAGTRGDIHPALDAAGISGLDPVRGGDLSAGQRRRLNLARLLAAPRAIWLLDEPTAALDADGQAALEAAMAGHRGDGGIVIAATHLPIALPGARTLRLEPVFA